MKTKVLLISLLLAVACKSTPEKSIESIDQEKINSEITALFQELIDYTLQKDMEKVLALYDNSENFKLINQDGTVITYNDLVEIYKSIVNDIEEQKIISHNFDIKPLNNELVFVSWYGEEQVKVKNADPVNSKWLTSFIISKVDGKWKFMYGNMSHF